MNRSPDLPHLRIVSTATLHPHELPDEQRAQPLVTALRRDRVLKNPPIVQPVLGREGEFVVLDGANRVTALRVLKLEHALVQISHPNGDSIRVRTWNHVLLEQGAERIEDLLRSLNGFEYHASEPVAAESALASGASLVNIVLARDRVLETVAKNKTLQARIAALRDIVAAYQGRVRFERTNAEDLESLRQVYRKVGGLVVFPEFQQEEVAEGAANQWHFPPGITRFIVSPRALRVNYPLDRLEGDRSLERKQAELEDWIRERVRDRRVRYYAESTFLFDE